MARSFNLTAEINLRAPGNLKTIVSQIRRELGTVSANVNLKIDPKAAKSVSVVKSKLDAVNAVLITAKNNTDSLNSSLAGLSSTLSSVGSAGLKGSGAIKVTSESAKAAAQNIKVAASGMEEFGKQAFLAVKRFAAFTFVTSGIVALTSAVRTGFSAFIAFDKELIRLQQVTGKSTTELMVLDKAVTNLAINLGVSSESLTQVAVTLAQAGLSANETKIALEALAKTELAPSFDNLAETTEGAIAVLRQFDLQAGDLEAALGSVNAVAAAFAVEADDLIAAIQRTGGVFAAASRGVSQGTDALNEFLALFTSVRQTTRESAETIATGLRTIFTRIQRGSTIEQLREFGIELTDLEGKFVGPFEAVKRLSEGLKTLDPRDLRFSAIVEELGGFRQIGKVIPLIQQFAVAQEALKVAQKGQGSLADAQVIAQKSLANQLAKVREQFLAFIRDVGKSEAFQSLFKLVLNLTSGLISLAGAFKPILPILAIVGAVKSVKAVGDFATGFFGAASKGSSRGAGESLGSTISGTKDKERSDVTARASEAIRDNTSALTTLTTAIEQLTTKIGSSGSTTLSSGGKVLGFNKGGVVPGSGKGDKVPAFLEPGEVVMSNNAVNKYGRGNLVRMNKYSWGGKVSTLAKYYKSLPAIPGYDDIKDQYVSDKSKFIQVTPENLTEADKKTWTNSKLARWEKFEYLLGRKYRLGPPAKGTGFEFLDFPKARAESKFLKKGDTYGDPDTLKGNNAATIAGKNFLFANSKGTNSKPKSLEYIDISNTPVTTYWADPKEFQAAGLNNGGKIQKFMAGSPGGITVASGKGRGVEGPKGARSYIDPISSETYLKWAKGIYDEYDADPSLVMAAGPEGLRRPPEIALADMLLAQYALETGGAGLSVGQKFVRTPSANITDELRPYLVPDPSDPNELGFFQDDVVKFGKLKKIPQQVSSEISQRKTTSKMQRELFGFALEGVAKSVRDKTLTKKQLDTLSPDVLEALSKDPQSQVFSLPKLKPEVASGSSTLLDTLKGPLSEFRKSGGQTSLSGAIPEAAAKQIEAALPGYIDSVSDDSQKVSKAKTTQKYFRSFVGGGTAEKPGHATAFAETINQMLKSGTIQGLANGGIVQRFMAGSIGGITEADVPELLTDPEIQSRLALLGGPSGIKRIIGISKLNELVRERVRGQSSAGMILKESTLQARLKSDQGNEYRDFISTAIKEAETISGDKAANQQNLNNQAQKNYAGVFGGAGMYQSGSFDTGRINLIPDSTKKRAIDNLKGPTSIELIPAVLAQDEVMKQARLQAAKAKKTDLNTQIGIATSETSASIAKQFGAEAQLEKISQFNKQSSIAYVSAVADALDTKSNGSRIFLDFDKTLAYGADEIGKVAGSDKIDLSAFSDITKVKAGLGNAKLSSLSKKLIQLSSEMDSKQSGLGSELLNRMFVVSARPSGTMSLISGWLNSKGLNIPSRNFVGVGGAGLSEADIAIEKAREIISRGGLGQGSVFIDDDPTNIKQSSEQGIISKQYGATMTPQFATEATQTEGLNYQDLVRQTLSSYNGTLANAITINKQGQSLDFPNGLGPLASTWFDEPRLATAPTDVKRTITQSKVIENVANYLRLAKGYAFGGRADGPSFEDVRQQIIDKYPEIDFGIRKRKKSSGFGYNLTGALKATGGLSGKDSVNFQQPTNLKQLQEYSDKLASKLMNPEQLAVGGLADATGAMQSLMSGLYGNRGNVEQSNKPKKNFGKIALRDSGSRIQATYIKEGQAGQDRSGQVIADKVNNSLYAVQSSAATKGYGPKLYDIVMEAATATGGMLTSDRRTVSDAAKGVWAYYFKNRADVKKTPLDPENWVSNSRLLDEKLYGPPDTWPPSTDPAWILQSGYSKAPNLINTPDVVRVDPIQKAIANNEPYLPDMFNRGGFASGGSVPAMVSNGEAFVPPKVAKKIGYAKLDRMNQADRNGMKGFAAGGISTFKGAGSGTSDSIGPIGLPQGSYVIREKATKALGLSRGGSVGSVQRFALGGTAQDQDYFLIKAKQAGQSLDVFAKTLVYSAKDMAKSLQEAQRAAKVDLKAISIELSDQYKAASSGSDQDLETRAQIVGNIGNKLREVDPTIDASAAKILASQIADRMSGGETFDELVANLSELKDLTEKTLTDSEAQTEALRKIASEKGLSPQALERLLGDRVRGNQDNGISRLIDFFGGPLKVTTRSLLLASSAFEEGAKYIYGAEKLSAEARGVLGGIRGGAQGAAVVAEMNVGSNVSEFGKFLESFGGKLGGVGQALQKFSGGIQAGAIAYAAVAGAITGLANAFNQAKLEQTLLKLSLVTDKTSEAFKRLEKNPTSTNVTLAQQALGQETESMEGLRRTAAIDARGKRSIETARSLDFTGITAGVSGQEQEKEARKAFFDASSRRFEQFGTLGEKRLNEVNPKEVQKAVDEANTEDVIITRLAKELEGLQQAPVKDEAAIEAKQGQKDTAQQAKAEKLFRKSQRFGQIAALEGEQEALRQFYINQAQTEEEKNQRLKTLNGQIGNTDKERADNQQRAIDAAKRLAAAEAETELRTKLLSDATQKLSLQTENLLRTYSVASAMLQRFGNSIDLIKNSAQATASSIEGRAQIGDVDRTNENILGNMEAYSLEEVRGAAVQTGQLAGGGLGGETLQNQILSAKVLQESLPQALATTSSEDVGTVINKLQDAFNLAGVEFSEPIKEQLRESLTSEIAGKTGVDFGKLAQESDIVANLLKQTAAGLKTGQEFQKRYNDALAPAIELQNAYAQALQQSIDYQIKASEIRTDGQINLKEALGQRVTSRERNAAFDTRIRTLTSTNVIPGGTTDPNQILQQLMSGVAGQQAQKEELDIRKQDLAAAPTAANAARVAEQMQAMSKQNVAINNSRKALEELANDGSKAANALKDLQEIDRVSEGATNFTRNVLTGSDDEVAKINKQLLAFTKFRTGQATGRDINNLEFRQNAFAGGDLIKSVLPKEIAEQLDAQISLDMLKSNPDSARALQSVVGRTAPDAEGKQQDITLESALSMRAGGRDPVQERYIKAYQDAVNVQATAAEALGKAAEAVAKTFNDKMIQILSEIQQKLPTILEQSVTAGMTPAVAAAYREINVAAKEKEALDVTQAKSMGLDAPGFNAVSTAYDAVGTSRERTENLVRSQAKAQGFVDADGEGDVEKFKTMNREQYDVVVGSDQYTKSVDAQIAAERNFGQIATAAGLDPETAAEQMTTYRTSDPYVAATTKIEEKRAAFEAVQAGPQPEKPEATKPLEVTPADTTAKEEQRQKQAKDDDFKSEVFSFGGHVAAFAIAVGAFALASRLSGGGGIRGLFGGRGGRGRGGRSPSVRPSVGTPSRRAAGAPASTPQSGPPRRGAGAAPSTPQSGPPRRGAVPSTPLPGLQKKQRIPFRAPAPPTPLAGAVPSTPTAGPPGSVKPVVATPSSGVTPSSSATKPSVSTRPAKGAATVVGQAVGAIVDKVSVLDEVVGVATSAANIATGQGTVQDVAYGAADAAELTGRGGGLFNFLNKIPGVGALTKGVGSAAGSIGTRLGVGGLASAAGGALGSFGTAIGVGKPILGASGGIGAGLGNFAALNTAISGVTNAIEFLSDPEAYSARKQAQSDAGLQRAQERTGYGEFALDSLGGALGGFMDPIGKIVEGGYVAKDLIKDTAAASEAQAKTERISTTAQKQISESRGGGAISKLGFDEQRKVMEEAQIKSELAAAQRVQTTGGSLGDVAKIFDTTEESLGATNLQDFIAKREARAKELPQDRIDSREKSKDGTWDWSSNMDPKGFAEAVSQEIEYRLSQVQLPPIPVKPEIKDDTKLQIDGKVAKDTDIPKTTEQKTSTEASKAVDTITSSSTLASKALDTMATSTQRFIDIISGNGQKPTAASAQTNAQSAVYSVSGSGSVAAASDTTTQQTNVFDDMKKAYDEMLQARSKVEIFNQGFGGEEADIKAYEEASDKYEKAKGAVRSFAQTKPQPTIPAPTPPGAKSAFQTGVETAATTITSTLGGKSQIGTIQAPTPPGPSIAPVIQSANVAPQVGVQPQTVSVPSGTTGLEPRPEIALQQAETQLALGSVTQPQVSKAPVTESVKLREDRQIVIDANRKAKQKKVDSLKKAVEAAEKNVRVNKIGGATGEKSKAVLTDKQAKLAAAQQDLSRIDSQERDELEEVRKDQQLRADLSGKQIQYTTQQTKPQTSSEQKKPLSPYEAEQKAKRDAFESNKKARRGAYLSRFRPEVAERMMTDEEKTSRDASRLAAGRATQQNSTTATSATLTPQQQQLRQQFTTATTPTSQPIPTPLQTTQTSPQFAAAQTVAADQGASAAAQQYTLSLDPASLTAFTEIQASFTEFGKYVSQLANIKLPNKIEITGGGNYTMDVNITGAAAMEMLQTETKKLAETFVVEEIKKLKDKLNTVFPSEFKASGSGGSTSGPSGSQS